MTLGSSKSSFGEETYSSLLLPLASYEINISFPRALSSRGKGGEGRVRRGTSRSFPLEFHIKSTEVQECFGKAPRSDQRMSKPVAPGD